LIQAVNEIKQQNSDDKSPSLGKLILNSLNKDTTRYLAKSQRNSEDVDSEEYKRQIFTNWCILAISNANNEPKLIKKALELLKARIIKLKAYYSWGSFFTPNSVKNINELLNRSELRGVVGIHSKDLAKQLEEDEKYFKSLIEQRARAIEQLAIEDKILQWRDPSDDDCSNSKIWRW